MTLDRATVDAELALQLARLENTRREANQAMDAAARTVNDRIPISKNT